MPQSRPQWAAVLSKADELFYGGQAGGGKSDLLIGLALTLHRKSIIFRREYPQLKDVVSRAKELTGDPRDYNGQDHIIRKYGRVLEFGAVQRADDVAKYKGRPHDAKLFDEVAEILPLQYRFLSGWLRSTIPDQRCRIVAAGNPPTNTDGEWIIEYWGAWLDGQHPRPAAPGELRWYARIDDKDVEVESGALIVHKTETIKPRSRTFIPARLSDNVFLAGTDYESVLQSLPEPLRSQLLYGDFKAKAGDNEWQCIPTAWVLAAMERGKHIDKPDVAQTCLGCDIARGGSDKTVIAKRYGNWYAPLVKVAGVDTPDGEAARDRIIVEREGESTIAVDVIGVGSSAYDYLRRVTPMTVGVNFAEKSLSSDKSGRFKFRNKRAEYYWRFRESLDPASGNDVCLPYDRELLADLCAPRYEITIGGILIEDKEEIKKRIGRSPDCGDAVILASHQRHAYGAGL